MRWMMASRRGRPGVRALVLALFLALTAAGAARADDLSTYYFNSDFWGQFDWSAPMASSLGKLPDWTPYSGAQDGRVTFQLQRQVTATGYQLTSALAPQSPGDIDPGMIDLTGEFTPSVCAKLITAMTTAFGTPAKSDDTSFTRTATATDQGAQAVDYQWDINKTRISAACSGAVTRMHGEVRHTGDVVFLATFTYTPNTEKLDPAFLIDCTRTQTAPAAPWPKGMDDLMVWIVPRKALVLDEQLFAIAEPGAFDIRGSVIQFTLKDGAAETGYLIDRVSGVLAAATGQGATAATISGVCTKLDPTQLKF
jgi:hypothetical protein